MASVIGICNLGLSHLGDEAGVSSIDPPEGSAQADHCALYYPIARDTVMERHSWNFALKRIAPAALSISDTEMPTSWGFGYGMPNKCLRILSVLAPGESDDAESEDFIVETLQDETRVIYTNVEDPIVRYISLIEDTARFPALVVNAISRLLASYLAGPVIKGTEGMKVAAEQYKWFEIELAKAIAADSAMRQRSTHKNFTPSSIAARA